METYVNVLSGKYLNLVIQKNYMSIHSLTNCQSFPIAFPFQIAPPSASSITHPTPTSKYIYIFVIVITFLIDRSHRFDFQIE